MLEVLYDNGPVLVVNKPAGIATQSPPGIDSLEVRVRAFYKQREQNEGNIYLGVPHRLDRPVSGAIVFGRHLRATQRLSKQFERRTVQKTYWGWLAGAIEPAEGTWQDTMRKVPQEPRAEILTADHPEAKSAVLHYRVIARGTLPTGEAISLLEMTLETGRMHQIRLQAATRGHAVLGDALYGSTLAFGPQTDDPRQRAIALHARFLSFEHPMVRQAVAVEAPLPDYWPNV